MAALAIRQDLSPSELRRLARFEPDRRASMRLLAIANALEGMSRAEAARLAGMERQALRDAVIRYNAQGPDDLHDRPRWGERLAAGRHLRSCRAGLWRAHQRVGDVAAAQAAGAVAPEGAAPASPKQPGRAGRVQKRSLAQSSRPAPRRIRKSRSSSGVRIPRSRGAGRRTS